MKVSMATPFPLGPELAAGRGTETEFAGRVSTVSNTFTWDCTAKHQVRSQTLHQALCEGLCIRSNKQKGIDDIMQEQLMLSYVCMDHAERAQFVLRCTLPLCQ